MHWLSSSETKEGVTTMPPTMTRIRCLYQSLPPPHPGSSIIVLLSKKSSMMLESTVYYILTITELTPNNFKVAVEIK
jgi:hypothetical protein